MDLYQSMLPLDDLICPPPLSGKAAFSDVPISLVMYRSSGFKKFEKPGPYERPDRFRHSMQNFNEKRIRSGAHSSNINERNRQITNKMKLRKDRMDKRMEADKMYKQIQLSKEMASFEKIRQLSLYCLDDSAKKGPTMMMKRSSNM